MTLLMLLLLDSWPVTAGQAVLDRLHGYDVLSYEIDAEPTAEGLRVDCRLRVKAERPGPLAFFLSGAVEGLRATLGEEEVPFTFGAFGLDTLLDLAGVPRQSLPFLLTLEPRKSLAAGEEATFRLTYTWRPPPGGWFRAGADDVETHLSGFWLPTMADEFFGTTLRVRTGVAAFAPGRARRTEDGWLFESASEQIVPLVVADLVRVEGDGCEVWLPEGLRGEGESIARDLAQVLSTLEGWFGSAGEGPFRLVLPHETAAPSYCGGSFAVLTRRPKSRVAWIAHLAHECAHRWFGFRLATPVVGRGGTWLREGLAEWAGIEVAGEIVGGSATDDLWRDRFARYVSRADLRRAPGGILFGNEPTLLDATYVDDPVLAYDRGALVLRLLAREAGAKEFRERLRGLMKGGPGGLRGAAEVLAATGGEALASYYAATTRLPDLRLDAPGADGNIRISCTDPLWPGGRVPVRVETATETRTVEVEVRGEGTLAWKGGPPVRIEVDPLRLYLDPVRSNGVWER
jgi:hypothetical protein